MSAGERIEFVDFPPKSTTVVDTQKQHLGSDLSASRSYHTLCAGYNMIYTTMRMSTFYSVVIENHDDYIVHSRTPGLVVCYVSHVSVLEE
jgi:hypothetical protein